MPILQHQQQAILRQFEAAPLTADEASRGAQVATSLGHGIVVELTRLGLLEAGDTERRRVWTLSERGRTIAPGRPLHRAVKAVGDLGPAGHEEIANHAGFSPAQFRFVLGLLRSTGALRIDGGGVLSLTGEQGTADAIDELLDQLVNDEAVPIDDLPKVYRDLLADDRTRGPLGTLVELLAVDTNRYTLTGDGRRVLVAAGDADKREIGFYDFRTPPAEPPLGTYHPLARAVRLTRRLLTRLGYQDVDLSCTTVEASAMDAMFIPAFHPARDVKHSLYLTSGTAVDEDRFVTAERVRRVHLGDGPSRGWGCAPPPGSASRTMLQPQVISGLAEFARTPARRADRLYATARCFRWDKPTRWHRPDFLLTEGLVLDGDGSVAFLVGLFEEIAEALFADPRVLVHPAYFPFTEPSVEIHVPRPDGATFELGGGGRIRPEVCAMTGLAEGCTAWWLNPPGLVVEELGLDSVAALYRPGSTGTAGSVPLLERADLTHPTAQPSWSQHGPR